MKKSKSYRAPDATKTQFIRILDGWTCVHMDHQQIDGTPVRFEYIVDPEQRIYRRALSWEAPTLVIDANILPAEHHIHLVRIRRKSVCRLIRKAFRKQQRLQGLS
jgi:hypothetical protein